MIYEKELCAPVLRHRTARRTLTLFGGAESAIRANGLHFRETDRGICCAEGAKFEEALGAGDLLLTASGHVLTQFIYRDGALSADGLRFPLASAPHTVLSYVSPQGATMYFAVTDADCFLLTADGEAERVMNGAACGCVRGERLFFASGSKLCWTKPLSPLETDIALRGAGEVELPSPLGDIHTLVSFDDRLYAFRERGVARITTPGDELSYRAEELPYAGGKIGKGTVRPCGGEVLFLAENGLYCLGEGKCVRLSGCGDAFADLTEAVTATAGGKYYAAVRAMDERCIWCVEPARRSGHLIRMRAEQLAGGEKLLFAEEGKLYSLTERGLPAMRRRECVLKTESVFLGLAPRNKFLDGIMIEGEGNFRVEAKGEYGMKRAVYGRAGEMLRFPLPVRGRGFSLDVRTIEENACIRTVVFDFREEVAKW